LATQKIFVQQYIRSTVNLDITKLGCDKTWI